jgi:plasmid maintenance system antidote protein VapI
MKAKKKYQYNPDYAVPPGETIREVMETFGMNGVKNCFKLSSSGNLPESKLRGDSPSYLTKRGFSARLKISVQTLNRIFKGEHPITPETTNRLEMLTGTPANFWNNLESNCREQLAKFAKGNISRRVAGSQSQ